MKNLLLYTFSLIGIATFLACNPDCESLNTVSAEVSPQFRQAGEGVPTEVKITTVPTNFLTDKEVFIDRNVSGARSFEQLTSRVIDNGRAAMLPSEATGLTTFYVKDLDCGGFVPLNSTNIVDREFALANRSLFIAPAPPLITVPTIQTSVPPNVVKTWFSPNDRDYCIWIVPEETVDANGNIIEQPNLVPGKPELFYQGGKIAGTREISVSVAGICGEPTPYSALFHLNPISGIVDRQTGYVSMAIDRTSKGLDVERYEGFLINPSSIPDEYQIKGNPCNSANDSKENLIMMVLTSQKTGRQVILYRIDLG